METTRATILLIEDDQATRRFLAENLAADGHHVVQAGTAADGEHAIETLFPDLVLLDLSLPDEPGLELLRRVRGSDRVASRADPEIPVIVISGRKHELDRLRGFGQGCDDYVCKPSGGRSTGR